MSESAYALVSVDELRRRLQLSGTEKTPLLEELVDQATDLIEQFLRRQIVTRGEVTEYHSPDRSVCDIYTRDWPIITIVSVAESTAWPRDYSSALVADTGYHAVKPEGLLRRLGSGGPTTWAVGSRTVKVVYSYGYATTDAVPARLKSPALKLCALLWAEATRGQYGISGASDSQGNWTRFSSAQITPDIAKELMPEKRPNYATTAERDA